MPGIYIHIPFCKQACSYCDFYFVTKTDLMNQFVDALCLEMEYWSKHEVLKKGFGSIYFGGGTPSRLAEEHWNQLASAFKSFDLDDLKEFTVEVNPDDITPEYLSLLKSIGVTRLSMGVQSFQPELLDFMHRAHSAEQAKQAIQWIQDADFNSFTLDLIYGNPGQTMEWLKRDLETFVSFNPPHLSAYSLTVEEGTRLGKAVKQGKVHPSDDEFVSEQMIFVQELLEKQGYERYEVSNYAKSGHHAVHNSSYWEHETYIGMGPAAHSFLWEMGKPAVRFQHSKDLKAYCENPLEREEFITLSNEELIEERFLISLRTKKGLLWEEMKLRYGFELTEKQREYLIELSRNRLVHFDEEGIRLTQKGWLLSDRIALEILTK